MYIVTGEEERWWRGRRRLLGGLGGLYRGTGNYTGGRDGNPRFVLFLKKAFSQQERFTGDDILGEDNTTVHLLAAH